MRALVVFLLGTVLGASATIHAGAPPTPPGQPSTGPGGAAYSHARVTAALHGEGARSYWLFEPSGPPAKEAPLIVFLHGWSAVQPEVYGAWIEHLVRRGSLVVFPLYQDGLCTSATDYTPDALAAVTDAIHLLQSEPGHAAPRLDRFGLAGHSLGGIIAADLAASWEQVGLPRPRALLCVEPGKTWGSKSPPAAAHLEGLDRIPRDTLLLTVVGDRDSIARDIDAKRIFYESAQIPVENKNYVTLVSDEHGQPTLQATHFAPVAPGGRFAVKSEKADLGPWRQRLRQAIEQRRTERRPVAGLPGSETLGRGVDALDYFGTWKLLDALIDAACFGRNRAFALGNTPEQRFMGSWSDGTPVRELAVTARP